MISLPFIYSLESRKLTFFRFSENLTCNVDLTHSFIQYLLSPTYQQLFQVLWANKWTIQYLLFESSWHCTFTKWLDLLHLHVWLLSSTSTDMLSLKRVSTFALLLFNCGFWVGTRRVKPHNFYNPTLNVQ